MEPGFSPLDEELELLPGSLSPDLHACVVRLGAMLPFGQVGPLVAMMGKVTISASMVRCLTEQAGAALVAVEEAAVAEIERTLPPSPAGADHQQVSVDGAMVPVLGGEWREAKTLVVGQLSATQPGKAEELSYFSRIQHIEPFTRLATGELHRRGTFAAPVVVGVVDGASWCQSFLDHHLPRAVRVLDYPHAMEHLGQAAQAVFGAGTAPCSEWLGVQTQTLLHGDPQVALDAVAALPAQTAAEVTIRDKVHAYLQPRLAQMAYASFAAQGFPIGSGIVESANKLVVEARLKGAGMHWAEANVDPMLALRCVIGGKRWEQVWPQISQHRRVCARRSKPRMPSSDPHPVPAAAQTEMPRILPQPTPRVRTMVNGKPTKDHPWNSRRPDSNQSATEAITKT